MRSLKIVWIVSALVLLGVPDAIARQCVVLTVGASGTDEYEKEFKGWAERWAEAASKAEADLIRVGSQAEAVEGIDDRDHLRKALEGECQKSKEPLWLVLIGHGTFDGREAKFNLRGPDVSAVELSKWLEAFGRPVAVVNCTSASGPFINHLSKQNRVIVTATKSGYEYNYARFGGYLATAIADPNADLDKDDQTSLLEAFLAASARTAEFYQQEARLATEHALLDDNGDGLGTPAAWFSGLRPTRRAADGAAVDGSRAHQLHLVRSARDRAMSPEMRARRDALELAVAKLREEKGGMEEDEYYARLEQLLLDLARLYEEAEKLTPAGKEGEEFHHEGETRAGAAAREGHEGKREEG